ncbi:MAG: pyridoxine 5'-phosphate synthase [Candidatus Omnitrophica bacterium]|nr:pyridoxine 5'-phosphate synthase [Candidatus Omnitrophota bacterium]
MAKLGVNIDHVATLREARRIHYPDPVEAAIVCEGAGCDSIVCHLREDRRHIKDEDVRRLREAVKTRLNLEMSIAKDIVEFACKVKPDQATLVPERRSELTTEGGLDVEGNLAKIKSAVDKLEGNGIKVSLFINPVKKEIDASMRAGSGIVELHTGEYANAKSETSRKRELKILNEAVEYASALGLEVNAGHGLNYDNTKDVAAIDKINELNIGHSIISKAVFIGLAEAVREMLELVR